MNKNPVIRQSPRPVLCGILSVLLLCLILVPVVSAAGPASATPSATVPPYLQSVRWLLGAGRDGKEPRTPRLEINNVLGLLRACQRGE